MNSHLHQLFPWLQAQAPMQSPLQQATEAAESLMQAGMQMLEQSAQVWQFLFTQQQAVLVRHNEMLERQVELYRRSLGR